MLIEEAMWFGRQLEMLEPSGLSPMLNLGSSTEAYRQNYQPWIDRYVLHPLIQRDVHIKNHDMKAMPGVDLVGDLNDQEFLRELSAQSFHSVLCFNLLEHVNNRNQIADLLSKILAQGGYLFVSCPYKFPYHPDPIDTRFRPDLSQLADLFSGLEKVSGEVVVCQTYFHHIYPDQDPWLKLSKLLARLALPFYRPEIWLLRVRHLPWLFRRLEATCLVLRKG